MARLRCPRCARVRCLCALVATPLAHAVEVVVLQHPLEQHEVKGTARLLTLALRSHRAGGLRREDPLGRLLRGYRVELLDAGGHDDNGYLRAPRFVVRRIGTPPRKTA